VLQFWCKSTLVHMLSIRFGTCTKSRYSHAQIAVKCLPSIRPFVTKLLFHFGTLCESQSYITRTMVCHHLVDICLPPIGRLHLVAGCLVAAPINWQELSNMILRPNGGN